MNHISIFFNTRIVNSNEDRLFENPIPSPFIDLGDIVSDRSLNIVEKSADVLVAIGDLCFIPLRYLFNGRRIRLVTKQGVTRFYQDTCDQSTKRNLKDIILSIISLVLYSPWGIILKGAGYLFKSIREKHFFVIKHYTPIDYTVGAPENRLDLKGIEQKLKELWGNNHAEQPTKDLIIYAQPGTTFNANSWISRLNPQKLILVGARIIHEPCDTNRLDDTLAGKNGWELGSNPRKIENVTLAELSTHVAQWKMKSVEDALKDVPPRKSIFSFERYKRIYVV